jgi:hypothetical protein
VLVEVGDFLQILEPHFVIQKKEFTEIRWQRDQQYRVAKNKVLSVKPVIWAV